MPQDDWINPINIAICQALPFVLGALSARLGVQLMPEGWRQHALSMPLVAR